MKTAKCVMVEEIYPSREISEVRCTLSVLVLNPLNPRRDQYVNSHHNFNEMAVRQVLRI